MVIVKAAALITAIKSLRYYAKLKTKAVCYFHEAHN